MWDELPSGPGRRDVRSWGRFITEASAASAAVLLSLTVFSLNGFYALRGSEIVVLPPERVLIYRSGEGDRSLLAVALPARLINTASQDYGDVLVSASMEFQVNKDRVLSFPLDALVEPVFTLDSAPATADCDYSLRCIQFVGARVAERDVQLLAIPGGSARSDYLSFRLVDNVCTGGPECTKFSNAALATNMLRTGSKLSFMTTLEFHSDGQAKLSCDVAEDLHGGEAAIFKYLEDKGWAHLICRSQRER